MFIFNLIMSIKTYYMIEVFLSVITNEFTTVLFWISLIIMWLGIVIVAPAYIIIKNARGSNA